jgi:DNA-binding transcriptional LysR family regulator
MDSISTFNVFVRVAETCSFTAAGRMLGLSASAIGKSIVRLEAQLGVRLFYRSTRSMTLTSEGQLFLARSRRILAEVAAAQAELSRGIAGPSGRLKISLPLVGEPFLPVLAQFRSRYPDVHLELNFSDRLVDLIDEGYDAVVRSGHARESRLRSRLLGTFTMLLVASADYLAARGTPTDPVDLLEHSCVQFRFPDTGKLQVWPLPNASVASHESVPASIVCNNLEARIAFATHGAGIAYLPDFAIADALEDGRLIAVLPEQASCQEAFYILWPSGFQTTPRLRALIDFLSEHLFSAKDAIKRH